LEPDCTYHIFNRANGNEKLFLNDDNYRYFLKRYEHFISPIADTFCYCLMPNHFHFLVRIKAEVEFGEILEGRKVSSKTLQGFRTLEGLDRQKCITQFISQQFSHLQNSYTQAFNKVNDRKGSLFMHPFKRIKVTDEGYLKKLVHYIHFNPIESGLTAKPEEWKYSSYSATISNKPTSLLKGEVLSWFDDLENFIHCHKYPPEITGIDNS